MSSNHNYSNNLSAPFNPNARKATTTNNLFGNGTGQKAWSGQENKFCKYCKCWVADNAVSQNFHEQGARHKKALEESLIEMKKKQVKDQKAEKFQETTLRKMEEAALESYKEKDVMTSRDFTAKLYNGEMPGTEGVVAKKAPSEMPYVDRPEEVVARVQKDPLQEVTGDAPDKWDKDYQQKMDEAKGVVPLVKGKTLFTPNTGQPKLWYEAKDDDGNTFYYHIKTSESRWDAPPWGFLSIEEQRDIEVAQQWKQYNKEKVIHEQREVHGERRKEEIVHQAMPDMSAKDPYGRGGFTAVEEEPKEPLPDLGLPAKRMKQQPVIEAEEERLVIKEKTVNSLSSFGLVPLPDQVEKVEKVNVITKPKISFRKRNIRERDDSD